MPRLSDVAVQGGHQPPVGEGEQPLSPPRKPNDRSARKRPDFTRYDQALLAAKNSGTSVQFDLATETSFTDSECTCKGFVCQVDRFSVEVLLDSGRTVWIAKPMIVGTEVLNA